MYIMAKKIEQQNTGSQCFVLIRTNWCNIYTKLRIQMLQFTLPPHKHAVQSLVMAAEIHS